MTSTGSDESEKLLRINKSEKVFRMIISNAPHLPPSELMKAVVHFAIPEGFGVSAPEGLGVKQAEGKLPAKEMKSVMSFLYECLIFCDTMETNWGLVIREKKEAFLRFLLHCIYFRMKNVMDIVSETVLNGQKVVEFLNASGASDLSIESQEVTNLLSWIVNTKEESYETNRINEKFKQMQEKSRFRSDDLYTFLHKKYYNISGLLGKSADVIVGASDTLRNSKLPFLPSFGAMTEIATNAVYGLINQDKSDIYHLLLLLYWNVEEQREEVLKFLFAQLTKIPEEKKFGVGSTNLLRWKNLAGTVHKFKEFASDGDSINEGVSVSSPTEKNLEGQKSHAKYEFDMFSIYLANTICEHLSVYKEYPNGLYPDDELDKTNDTSFSDNIKFVRDKDTTLEKEYIDTTILSKSKGILRKVKNILDYIAPNGKYKSETYLLEKKNAERIHALFRRLLFMLCTSFTDNRPGSSGYAIPRDKISYTSFSVNQFNSGSIAEATLGWINISKEKSKRLDSVIKYKSISEYPGFRQFWKDETIPETTRNELKDKIATRLQYTDAVYGGLKFPVPQPRCLDNSRMKSAALEYFSNLSKFVVDCFSDPNGDKLRVFSEIRQIECCTTPEFAINFSRRMSSEKKLPRVKKEILSSISKRNGNIHTCSSLKIADFLIDIVEKESGVTSNGGEEENKNVFGDYLSKEFLDIVIRQSTYQEEIKATNVVAHMFGKYPKEFGKNHFESHTPFGSVRERYSKGEKGTYSSLSRDLMFDQNISFILGVGNPQNELQKTEEYYRTRRLGFSREQTGVASAEISQKDAFLTEINRLAEVSSKMVSDTMNKWKAMYSGTSISRRFKAFASKNQLEDEKTKEPQKGEENTVASDTKVSPNALDLIQELAQIDEQNQFCLIDSVLSLDNTEFIDIVIEKLDETEELFLEQNKITKHPILKLDVK